MDFLGIMHEYFRGERAESLWFIVPLGGLSLAFAVVVARTQRGGFMWGMMIPFVLLGIALLVTGGTVGWRTPAQVQELSALFQQDPAALVRQEIPRMQQVNRMWPIYLTTWCAFLVVGVGLRFALAADWAHGLGIALVFFGGVGLMIDGFAERRARPYTQALEHLEAEVAPAPSG